MRPFVLNPDIKLSVYLNGRLIKAPILLTVIGLRETLLVASDYDEAKVNQICSRLYGKRVGDPT